MIRRKGRKNEEAQQEAAEDETVEFVVVPEAENPEGDTTFTKVLEGKEVAIIEDDEEPSQEKPSKRVQGWGRIFRGNKLLWITAIIGVVCLAAGLLVGTYLIAPASAGEAPKPGLVTVPVELGELSNDVTIRADVGYADSVEVKPDTSSISGTAVITGQVPEVGTEFNALSIAMEIAGRPVIVLPGELPAYRTLRFGVSGPDVAQLKQALAGIGLNPGDVASPLYDQATADAVAQMYAQAGYPAPPAEEGADEAYRGAQSSLRSAEQSVAQAQKDLAEAGTGASTKEIFVADSAVAAAQRALDTAKACVPSPDMPCDADIAGLTDALTLARLDREELNKAGDTTPYQQALESANQQLVAAQEDLEKARQSVQPYLPSSEVLYLNQLPRRVDSVNFQRGSTLDGNAAMTVSGATVRLTGAAAEADAKLLTVGGEATFELADGTPHRAVIAEAKVGEGDSGRWTVIFEPDEMTVEQIQQLQGSNVRVQIPVGATEGEVLSVPLAALTAGPGGESRVEVVESDPREGEEAETRLVTVETGLAAQGAVEITPVEGKLEAGDLVVVGR